MLVHLVRELEPLQESAHAHRGIVAAELHYEHLDELLGRIDMEILREAAHRLVPQHRIDAVRRLLEAP